MSRSIASKPLQTMLQSSPVFSPQELTFIFTFLKRYSFSYNLRSRSRAANRPILTDTKVEMHKLDRVNSRMAGERMGQPSICEDQHTRLRLEVNCAAGRCCHAHVSLWKVNHYLASSWVMEQNAGAILRRLGEVKAHNL